MALEIDRRQRLAAAILLSAVDLPQPMSEVAHLWSEADKVCPGVKVGEVPIGQSRIAMLAAAGDLIDQMLAEAQA